jgi:hypothetical protein
MHGADQTRVTQLMGRVLKVLTCALGCQGLLGPALAGSPFARAAGDRSPVEEHRGAALRGMAAAAVARLDLSLPRETAPTNARGTAGNSLAESLHFAPAAHDEEFAVEPDWHGPAPRLSRTTPLQDLVRNERREGVPLARLWRGRGAALNLGLSPRGRPGVWFVKTVP